MEIVKPEAKVYIDGANMFYTQKKLGWFIDWKKMKDYLKEKWDIIEVRYYIGVKSGDEKMSKFLRYLDNIGFKPITKPLKEIKITQDDVKFKIYPYPQIYKCNFDVEMTTDILLDRTQLDQILLFSGDSDFTYLVKTLRDLGKDVIVFSTRKMIAWELKLVVKKYIFLEDLREEIERK